MTEAAEAAKVVNMVCFNYRRVPAIALAKRMIEDGTLDPGRVPLQEPAVDQRHDQDGGHQDQRDEQDPHDQEEHEHGGQPGLPSVATEARYFGRDLG